MIIIKENTITPTQRKILLLLSNHDNLRSKEVSNLLTNSSDANINNWLNNLYKRGYLDKVKSERSSFFIKRSDKKYRANRKLYKCVAYKINKKGVVILNGTIKD